MRALHRSSLALSLTLALSATQAASTGGYTTADAGIVTPDVATGMRVFTHYNNDVNGSMVICAQSPERNGACETGWKLLKDQVPGGRSYVGFRIVSGAYGHRHLELYWK